MNKVQMLLLVTTCMSFLHPWILAMVRMAFGLGLLDIYIEVMLMVNIGVWVGLGFAAFKEFMEWMVKL